MSQRVRWNKFAFLISVAAITIVTFSRAFKTGYFEWDDGSFLQNNEILKLTFWQAVRASFGHIYLNDYLPVTLMSYWVEIKLFGFNPIVQHAVNLALHLENILLLYLFLNLLGLSEKLGLGLCLLFAVHPIQTEVLMWVSNRNLLLCSFFILLSCITYLKNFKTEKYFLFFSASIIFYILSLCCKSAGIFLPLLFILMERIFGHASPQKALKRTLPFFVVLIFAAWLRSYAGSYGQLQGFLQTSFQLTRILQIPIATLNALALYLKMVFLPWGYSIIYPPYLFTWGALVGASLVVILFFSLFNLWQKNHRWEYPFFSTMALVFLLPVLQIIPRQSYVNDRYLYLPITAIGALLLTAIQDLGVSPKVKKLGWIFLISLPFFAYARTLSWESNLSLWKDTVEKNPESTMAQLNLGVAYKKEGLISEAVSSYEKALTARVKDTSQSMIYNDLAAIYSSPDSDQYYNFEKAADYYMQSIKVARVLEDTFIPRLNLAHVQVLLGDKLAAIATLKGLEKDLLELKVDQNNLFILKITQDHLKALANDKSQ